jgi:uncharacterized protein YjeT (DUF2065 family)
MIDLKFWFMFFGYLLLIAAFASLLCPVRLKKIFKQIFKDANHIRSIAIWYLSVGPLAMYSGAMSPSFMASYLVFLVGLAFTIQGVLLFFCTKWYQSNILKPVLRFSANVTRLIGIPTFLLGLCFLYYGLFFL